jgi:hypothetical protein
LRELYTNLRVDIVPDSKKKRMEWIEHAIRMEHKTEGSRRRGRPKLRCLLDVEKYVQEMKVKRWRQKAVDREERASVIKKAKAVRGA